MDRLKGIHRPSWAPGGSNSDRSSSSSSSSSSSRLDSVKGLLPGRSRAESNTIANVRPISELRDPTSYPPPPKRDPNAVVPPPPPYRRATVAANEDERPPPLPQRRSNSSSLADTDARPPSAPPKLPPRLPPRRKDASATEEAPEPQARPVVPPPSSSRLNAGAVSRLGKAGITVPGLGIGSSDQKSPPPSQGTTLEDKKTALVTANKFYKDPTSVSFRDARAAASTAQNFHARHGNQVASGYNAANRLAARAGVNAPELPISKGNAPPPIPSGSKPPSESSPSTSRPDSPVGVEYSSRPYSETGKKPPPLPPKKKPSGFTKHTTPPGPPPVPLSSRPSLNTAKQSPTQ